MSQPSENDESESAVGEMEEHFMLLDPDKVHSTVKALGSRIGERFPNSGLSRVCAELTDVCARSRARLEWIEKPIWTLRIPRYLLLGVILVGLVATALSLRPGTDDDAFTMIDFIQTLEAGINDVVLISIAVFFVWTLESRVKRKRAMTALHQLRSIAHVIDMHQLTKDPDRVLGGRFDTQSSPKSALTPFALRRYLDYCSEMLSLTSKVAAIHLQTLDDPTVVAAVNEIESLTTGLSRKIWQKIDMVRSEEKREDSGAKP